MQSLRKSLNNMNETIQNSIKGTDESLNRENQPERSFFPSMKNEDSVESDKSFKSMIESEKPVTSILRRTGAATAPVSEKMESAIESVKSVSEKAVGFLNFKSIIFVILVILFLAFIGFNIFTHLGEGTDLVANALAPITRLFAMITGDTAKTTISNTDTGAKKIVETASDTTQNVFDYVSKGTMAGISFLQDSLKKDDTNGKQTGGKKQNGGKISGSTVQTANEDSITEPKNQKANNKEEEEPEPTRTNTLNQGYCYIGKINDTRYCAKVSGRNQCMSGDIYPSMDICINPNLRA